MPTKHLQLHRDTDGYWRTRWTDDEGRRHTRSFGRNRDAAYERFYEFQAEWKAKPWVKTPGRTKGLTVAEGWQRFDKWATDYYTKRDGTPTGEATNLRHAFQPMLDLYASTPLREVTVQHLRAARDRMLEDGLVTTTMNARVNRIRRVFNRLVEMNHCPALVAMELRTLAPVKPGRAVETLTGEMVKPEEPEAVVCVPEHYVWQTVNVLPPTLAALVRVLLHTGMRPGEACIMRPMDIVTTGNVWEYTPATHKTQHAGKSRLVLIGPRGQQAITPFLDRPTDAYLFDPRDALQQRHSEAETHRRPDQRPNHRQTDRRVGDKYNAQTLGYAIRRACEANNIPHWSPGQLRHNFLTLLRRESGRNAAQDAADHSDGKTTDRYTVGVKNVDTLEAIRLVG